MATDTYESLACEFEALRGDLITEEGYDRLFEHYDVNAPYAAIAEYWTESGINLLGNTACGESLKLSDEMLAANFELWDRLTAVRMAIDPSSTPIRTKGLKRGEFRTHIDDGVGDVFLANPRVDGDAWYLFYPPTSDKCERWNLFLRAKQLITGPDPENPVAVKITPALLTILAGNAVEATDFLTREVRHTTIPHAVKASKDTIRDLVVSHTAAA